MGNIKLISHSSETELISINFTGPIVAVNRLFGNLPLGVWAVEAGKSLTLN
jgi:hypothetical protein